LIVGTVAASADALPDSPLYPVKGLVENARGLLMFSPVDRVNYHLELAGTRLREAQAMFGRHRDDLAEQALAGLALEIKDAATDINSLSASDLQAASQEEHQLEQAIQTHDAQLAGMQANVTNLQALSAIQAARDRAQQTLSQTRSTVNSKGNPGGSSVRGKGRPTPSAS
jgi:TolA-binding protein